MEQVNFGFLPLRSVALVKVVWGVLPVLDAERHEVYGRIVSQGGLHSNTDSSCSYHEDGVVFVVNLPRLASPSDSPSNRLPGAEDGSKLVLMECDCAAFRKVF